MKPHETCLDITDYWYRTLLCCYEIGYFIEIVVAVNFLLYKLCHIAHVVLCLRPVQWIKLNTDQWNIIVD